MATAHPTPSTPPETQPSDGRPRYRLPEDAFTSEERRQLAKGEIDPVDVDAVLTWLAGEGPYPWPARSR